MRAAGPLRSQRCRRRFMRRSPTRSCAMPELLRANPTLTPIDGRRLPKEYRDALSPGGMRCDEMGIEHRLPRFFYEIPSWDFAMAVRLTQNFGLWELIQTDVREAPVLQSFPRYVPCALPLL